MNKKADKNKSPIGVYVASYVERIVQKKGKNRKLSKNKDKKYTVWENTIFIKANSFKEAYSKAIKFGSINTKPYKNSDGEMVEFVFEGISMLSPVYEELEDGSELLWSEYEEITDTEIREMIKSEKELKII